MTPCSSHCACCARWKTALEAVGPERAATIEIVRTALADAAVALKLVEPEYLIPLSTISEEITKKIEHGEVE